MNRVPAGSAQLSHPLVGLTVPHSLASGPGSFLLGDLPWPPVITGDGCLHAACSRTLSPLCREPCPAAASPVLLAHHALAFLAGSACSSSSPSSWLQLPGEAGQFPLVVDDLQLLDKSPGAGRTPGAQGRLRAWQRRVVRRHHCCFVNSISSPPRSPISFPALCCPPLCCSLSPVPKDCWPCPHTGCQDRMAPWFRVTLKITCSILLSVSSDSTQTKEHLS